MKLLSLGAGVQSTTILLMANLGEVDVDVAVFADTGWEPTPVYSHLSWLREVSSIPIHTVQAGNIREDSLEKKMPSKKAKAFFTLPAYMNNLSGKESMLRRQCSKEYKLKPIRRWIRENLVKGERCEMMIGISTDEAHRMRDSEVKYIANKYPLIDKRMSRNSCLVWLEKHGYQQPPKSACIGCPFHSDAQWRDIRDNNKEGWEDAVDFDTKIRRITKVNEDVYLHRQMLPLNEVDLSTQEDHGQLSLFGNECLGLCDT